MHDPNRLIKWVAIIALVTVALAVLYPPQRKLKGGIDLVGGTSLLYEIDTTGLRPDEQRDLSTRVMHILKQRVDPQGQMNLEWRPVGGTRLEVRMPRPPAAALLRREAYNQAIERLTALNLKRREVEVALGADNREVALAGLQRGVSEREPLLKAVATTYDEHKAAQTAGEAGAIAAKSAAYESALAELLATSLPVTRVNDVFSLPEGEKRDAELQKLRNEFPSYDAGETKLLTQAASAYDAWADDKADLEDPSDLKRRLRGAGVLEFRILADRDPSSPEFTTDPKPQLKQPIKKYTDQLARFGPKPKPADHFRWLAVNDVLKFTASSNLDEFNAKKDLPHLPIIAEYAGRYYVLVHNDPEYGMLHSTSAGRAWSLRNAYPDRDPMTGHNIVTFVLDPRGGRLFGELTGPNIKRQLCIVLDNTAVSHATIQSRITEHCQISGGTGGFRPEDVQYLVSTLDAGSLPARLKETPLSEQTVGPSLGETNRRNGLRACMIGGALVALFVLFYYGLAGGGVANIALAMNLLFTLSIMAMMQAAWTLPGIAGLILSFGMSIDANVLIFERIREERARGVPFKKALTLGYDKAFSAILDGNLTTMITCIILGSVGSEEIKGFAIALGIGIAISMFTALTVTRLIYTTMVAKGLLHDFSMRKLIGVPSIDWVGMRRVFWPASIVASVGGLGLFIWMSAVRTESFFDIEFLGGTSVQIDLKPGYAMTDEQVSEAITSEASAASAAGWLQRAADHLVAAKVADGEVPGQFTLTSNKLTADQMLGLVRKTLEPFTATNGLRGSESTATLDAKPGLLTLESLRTQVANAAEEAREAADHLRRARVQSVGDLEGKDSGLSYEVVTVETNRPMVQAAVLAALGEKLAVQRAIRFNAVRDAELTKEPYFVIEADDKYLSDVLGGEASFDVQVYRGGVAVKVDLDAGEQPVRVKADPKDPKADSVEKRIREVGLQPEFEQLRAREWEVIPLGPESRRADGTSGHRQFVVVSVDDSLSYDEDPNLWTESVAKPELGLVTAALGSEKSFSKVIQFAPQIAGQTTSRAVFATVLAMLGIGAYVWFRFGTREFGLAVLVTVVHDVCIVLGLVAASHWIQGTIIGRGLLIEDFRFDLTMLAAVLTIIGYQLNDTIVVFDRIRENRGRSGTLSVELINASINQTMSRTVLTATLVTLTVITLYVFGGDGIHGFAFAMLTGTLVGTYSTVAVAVPLVHSPLVLRGVVWVIAGVGLIALALAVAGLTTVGWVLSAVIAVACGALMMRNLRSPTYWPQPA
jgi:SecD/SecF fusion protein